MEKLKLFNAERITGINEKKAVGIVGFEGGPKNPLKGTSMKFLVLAHDAQSRAGAGG